MRAVLVFCEGRHDAVFVQRSLNALGECRPVKKAIGKLPSPFGPGTTTKQGLLAKRLADFDLEDLTLTAAASPRLPCFEAPLENRRSKTLFFPVRTGGQDHVEPVKGLLRDLATVFEPELVDDYEVAEYAAAFLFDADEDGVEQKLTLFRTRFTGQFGDLSEADHGKWLVARVPVGCFVFHRSSNDPTGTLEDHLEPMAKEAWPRRYKDARRFLDGGRGPTDQVSRNKAELVKATITVSGQFDHPGDPMTQIIRDKRLPNSQFQKSALSRALTDFLKRTPWRGSRGQ